MKNIMYSNTLFIVLLSIFFSTPMCTQNLVSSTEIHSFSDPRVARLLEEDTPQKAIIFFDLDDTVVTCPDMLLHEHFITPQFVAETVARHPQLLRRKNVEHYISIAFTAQERVLTDNVLPILIQALKDKGYTVVGLTATLPGKVGIIEDTKEYRFKELENLGITFSNTVANKTFTQFKKKRGRQPELYNGIIFCNREKKGKVVKAFVDELSFRPMLITLFDDAYKNITSVQQTAEKLDIPFQGFLYLGARHPHPFDKKRARHQIKHLIKHGQWIGDEDADEMLRLKTS